MCTRHMNYTCMYDYKDTCTIKFVLYENLICKCKCALLIQPQVPQLKRLGNRSDGYSIYVLYEKIVSGVLDFIVVVCTFNLCCKTNSLGTLKMFKIKSKLAMNMKGCIFSTFTLKPRRSLHLKSKISCPVRGRVTHLDHL